MSNDNHIIQDMRANLNSLQDSGWNFPNEFKRENFVEKLRNEFGNNSKDDLASKEISVSIAGRIMANRRQGKVVFIDLQDTSDTIQLFISKGKIGEDLFEIVKNCGRGDIIGVKGMLFITQRGEFSVMVSQFEVLNKCLRPLPDNFCGLNDRETRYRQRYLDLIMNQDTRNTFKIRSKIVSYIRRFFDDRDFLEVETNLLQSVPSGANAKKFDTHMESLDIALSLRVAPELALKRLVVGGIYNVYEIGKNFRNEGLSPRHNPEFTMVEFYQAYSTYHDLMNLTEELLNGIATNVLNSDNGLIPYGEFELNFSEPFLRMTVVESIINYVENVSVQDLTSLSAIKVLVGRLNISINENWGLGRIQMEIFDELVESNLIQPTFITEYPKEVSPLARVSNHNIDVTDRFELFIAGRELANGFSELNDSKDQYERFMEQIKEKELGDDEAMPFDADYITALEYALPPTAGEGIGIDRLVMLFTNSSTIRDVVLFPQLRNLD
jgi:lysyl-tRNA synthetase class 2